MKETNKKKIIFFSYGHDEYAVFVHRLARDLEAEGHLIWVDKDKIKFSNMWTSEIEDGIDSAEIVFAFMTKHGFRKNSGICNNEVIYARNQGKPVTTIKVEEMSVPLMLCDIHYLDAIGIVKKGIIDEIAYQEIKETVLKFLTEGSFEIEALQNKLIRLLKPQMNTEKIIDGTKDFVGRQWLDDIYCEWVLNSQIRTFLIIGAAGSGKSKLVSNMAATKEEIIGVHYCEYDDLSSLNVNNIIRTIAYYLTGELKEYLEFLRDKSDLSKLDKMNDENLFKFLLVDSLKGINSSRKMIFAIDAIDEMDHESRKTLLFLLEKYNEQLPNWLGFIVTSRFDFQTEALHQKLEYKLLDTQSEKNKNDVYLYIEKKFQENSIESNKDIISKIYQMSEGIFQFAVMFTEDYIKYRTLDETEHLGVENYYFETFKKRFKKDEFIVLRDILEIIVAAKEPVNLKVINDIYANQYTPYLLSETLEIISDFIQIEGKNIRLRHKSLYDFFAKDNHIFHVSKNIGNNKISKWIYENIHNNTPYQQKYALSHFLEANNFKYLCEYLDYFPDRIIQLGKFYLKALENKEFSSAKNHISKIVINSDNNLKFGVLLTEFFIENGEINYAKQVAKLFNENADTISKFNKLKINRNEGIYLLEDAKKLETLVTDLDLKIMLYNYIGDINRLLGERPEALEYYEKAIDLAGFDVYDKAFTSYYYYYDLRYVDGYFEEALEKMNDAEQEIHVIDNRQYRINRLKGNIYYMLNEYELSNVFFSKCLEIGKELGNLYFIAESHFSLASNYAFINEEKYHFHINLAKEIAQQQNYNSIYNRNYLAIVDYYLNKEDYFKVIEEGLVGSELLKETYPSGRARLCLRLAKAYFNLKEYEKALDAALITISHLMKNQSYPALMVQGLRYVLESAEKLGKLSIYKDVAKLNNVKNYNKFSFLKEDIKIIKGLTGEYNE